MASSDYDKEKLQERVAKLAGGVAVIKVGASTEIEATVHDAAANGNDHCWLQQAAAVVHDSGLGRGIPLQALLRWQWSLRARQGGRH
ncbi:MAG: hypothetical protein NT117_01180 [Gammaproteobacteria bacterium]|nr:hypothetical protein [Gammaproteobacteria bacterium]